MKKIVVLLILLSGFMMSDLNAQSCCSPKKECKPKQCCPAQPNCCKDTKVIKGSESNISKNDSKSTNQKKTNLVRKED